MQGKSKVELCISQEARNSLNEEEGGEGRGRGGARTKKWIKARSDVDIEQRRLKRVPLAKGCHEYSTLRKFLDCIPGLCLADTREQVLG